jgi:hypothetical protein
LESWSISEEFYQVRYSKIMLPPGDQTFSSEVNREPYTAKLLPVPPILEGYTQHETTTAKRPPRLKSHWGTDGYHPLLTT